MSEVIRIEVSESAKEIVRTLKTMPQWMLTAEAKALDYENNLTVGHIQKDYLSFPKDGPTTPIGCRVRSNRLRGSLRASRAIVSGQNIQSAIGSNVIYAAMQEFGGDIPAHKIVPKNGKALVFRIGDRIIFAKSVNMPAQHREGRHFIRNGITDRLPYYGASISEAIIDSWNANGGAK